MRINADFSIRAVVIPSDNDWIMSPESGVDRLMLDRIGDEVARATSLVRFAPKSSFSPYLHPEGEEFLVLDGVFSDENGDYPTGTYIRNPPGTSHSPSSAGGCRLLVKLRQFDPQDLTPVVIDTGDPDNWSDSGETRSLPLHAYGSERVWMQAIAAGERLLLDGSPCGIEAFVVRGLAEFDRAMLPAESWLRLPAGDSGELLAEEDCLVWLKSGHLPAC